MRTVHSLPLADICQRIARVHTAPGQPRAWRARPAGTCAAAVRRCGFTPLPPNVRSTVQGSCCSRSMILRPRCRLPQSLHGRPPWPGEATRAARQRQQLASQTPPAPPVLCFDCLHVCFVLPISQLSSWPRSKELHKHRPGANTCPCPRCACAPEVRTARAISCSQGSLLCSGVTRARIGVGETAAVSLACVR